MRDYCRETLEQALLYVGREGLTDERLAEIRHHLDECPPCHERYELEAHLIRLVGEKGNCSCPEGLKARITNLIQEI